MLFCYFLVCLFVWGFFFLYLVCLFVWFGLVLFCFVFFLFSLERRGGGVFSMELFCCLFDCLFFICLVLLVVRTFAFHSVEVGSTAQFKDKGIPQIEKKINTCI